MQPETTPTNTPNPTNVPAPSATPTAPKVTPDTPHETVGVADPVAMPTTPNESATTSGKQTGLIAGAIIVTLVALAAAAFWYNGTQSDEVASVGGVTYPAVVAVVNGQEVSVAEFQQSYDQAAAIAAQQGFDPATNEEVRAEIENQAITVVVNTALLTQAALAAGIEATDEAVQAEVMQLETQFGGAEQLATALAGAGLDDAAMRADLREQILVEEFITSSPEWEAIAVTDEEVQALYDEVAAVNDQVPPFADVEPQVRAQLLSQKQEEATNTLIERMRADAEIEVMI